MSQVHIAGLEIEVHGRYLRQRCGWCGEVLLDYDYTLTASPGEWRKPSAFPVNKLIRVEGGNTRIYSVLEDVKLPDDACTP
jgi:hypothetical protein